MLRFTESRRDSKKVHRSLWLDCCFGKGEPWVWVLAVRMQNSVWEQWLELKHPFPRWLPLLLDHRLFFVLHFWLRPNASAPMRRVQTDHFSPQQPIILVGNFSEKQRCTFEPSQDGMGTKPRSILSQRSALAAEKQGHFCPFEGKLQRLLCFSPHSFLLLGVWYAEDVRGCLRKSRSEIWFRLRHMREAMSPEERQHTKSCGLGALKHDGQTSWGFQDHILDMGILHSLVLCKVLWFLGDLPGLACMGSHFCMMVWFQQVVIFTSGNHPGWSQKYHMCEHS